ncbi:hypothetical protein ACHAXT_007265 [Thalassiosira profunda]
MTTLRRAAAALLALLSAPAARAMEVGDEVCITGFIMDRWCIEETGGTLLDNPSIISLQQPEEHSYHCLLDVGVCRRSGFVVLGPKNPATDRHCLGFRIDDGDAVLAAGRAAGRQGYCTTCTGGEDDPEYGYRATVRGIVDSLGDGSEDVSGTPVLRDVEMLDAGVGCGAVDSVSPQCARQLQTAPEPTPDPTPAPVATETGSTAASNSGGEALSCPDALTESAVIDPSATLFYAMVPSDPADAGNGVFCARLEVENDGWVGLAFSSSGGMADSTGVIGVPGEGTVRKYELFAYGVTEMTEARQTLIDASIAQDGDTTIMSFAKLLEEEGEVAVVEGSNTMLHARGGDSVSYHGGADRFVFEVDLSASAAATDAPTMKPVTVSPTMKPSLSPVTESPTMKPSVAPVTESPTMKPTLSPVTESPVMSPVTLSPVATPTASPVAPTLAPMAATDAPTGKPSIASATPAPSTTTTVDPTDEPTAPPATDTTTSPSASPFAFNVSTPPTGPPTAPAPTASTTAPNAMQFTPGTAAPNVSSASAKSLTAGAIASFAVAATLLG